MSSSVFHRVEKYLLNMPQSPTSLQTEWVCRFFIESCKIFTEYATITNVSTNGHSPSVFYRELKNIYCICHNHRQTNSVGKCPTGIYFFGAHCPSVKPLVFFLRKELATKHGITDEHYSDRRIPSVKMIPTEW